MGTVPDPRTFEARLAAFKQGLRDLASYGGDRATELKARAVEAEHVVEERAKTLAAKATELIRRYPVASVMLAFGVGYVLVRKLRR